HPHHDQYNHAVEIIGYDFLYYAWPNSLDVATPHRRMVTIQPVTVPKSQTNRNMMLAVHPVIGRISVDGFHQFLPCSKGSKYRSIGGL
ncbi:MAG: hypothetical protein EBT86_10905, partial [Actinobacteria bacterium]|nr:hypothetical protein [Actinomycetota bacterium]